MQIKIHFNDLAEKPLTFYHVLKLFHNASPGKLKIKLLYRLSIKFFTNGSD